MADTGTPQSSMNRCCPALRETVHRFIFKSEEFPVASRVARVLFGVVAGIVLFLGIAHNLPLTFHLKLALGYVFVALCIAGGLLSSSFRCFILLVFPSMLGSRGRSYLMLMTLSVLYAGPFSNILRNVEAASMSVSCNLDLQVRHSKLLWREAIKPFQIITQRLVDDKAGFELETLAVSKKFQDIRNEIVLQYGYDKFEEKPNNGESTQDQFTAKTLQQCDNVVAQAMQRCSEWFDNRWEACMQKVAVPGINYLFCAPMRLNFVCNILNVMTPWCRENVPVAGNFGQLYDRLNTSIDQLSREFSAELTVEEEDQSAVIGPLLDQQFTNAVKASIQKLTERMGLVLTIMQLLLSITFITIFIQAFWYLREYKTDICFDNVYITTFFRRIDACRQKAGKLHLLPLKKREKNKLIDPCTLKIYPAEVTQVVSGVFQVLVVFLLSAVLLTVDFLVSDVLEIISRHTFTHFNITKCMSPPSNLTAEFYVTCASCILLAALFSCLQVYANRLRRVIAAFYNPEREKTRIVLLYNLHIHRRISITDRKHIKRGGRTVFQRLLRWGLCLFWLPDKQEKSSSETTHYASA